MDFTRIDYDQVQDRADQLNSSSIQMENLLTEIKNLFDKIGTEEVWSGTVASETKETFGQLSAKFPEFSNAVNEYYKYLTSAVENYKAVDAMVSGNQ